MKLILSKFDLQKKIIVLHSFPNQNLSDEIYRNLEKFYDRYEDDPQKEISHKDFGPYLSYIFQIDSAWFPDTRETLMLTLYFEEHENTHLFKKELKDAVLKLKEIPHLSKISYVNTPHADSEAYKIYGKVINLLTSCFFEVNKLHSTYNLGLAEVLILGDAGGGKTSIVDYLIHGKFIPQTNPTLTPQIYDLVYNQIDFRVLDVCCDHHIKEVFEEHPLDPGMLPQAVVYVVDVSLDEVKQKESIKRYREWIDYLYNQYPKGKFQKIPILILFNKIDIYPQFDFQEYKRLYTPKGLKLNIKYSESSVKTGQGLTENFSWVVKGIKITEQY